MKVMLVGGTGVLSKDIAKKCIKDNLDLYMINRGKRPEHIPDGANIIIGDIYNPIGLEDKLGNLEFDVVVDFLSYNPDQLLQTLKLFRGKCKQYIFISSATVYSKKNPEVYITEETPLTNYEWDYAKNKIECEQILQEEYRTHNLQYTIVRPYITYGTTRIPFALISKKQHWTLINRILNDKPVVVWDDGKARCTLTHTEDFAEGVVGLFGKPEALGEDFHITTDECISWQEALEKIGKAVGKEVKIVYIPSKVIENEMPEMRGELTEDKSITRIFDNMKIKSVVNGFQCTTIFEDGIRQTIKYYQQTPEMMSIDNRWNAKIDILIYKYYRNNFPDNLNNIENFDMKDLEIKNNISYLKNISIVQYYGIINKTTWFIKSISRRIKKIINKQIDCN